MEKLKRPRAKKQNQENEEENLKTITINSTKQQNWNRKKKLLFVVSFVFPFNSYGILFLFCVLPAFLIFFFFSQCSPLVVLLEIVVIHKKIKAISCLVLLKWSELHSTNVVEMLLLLLFFFLFFFFFSLLCLNVWHGFCAKTNMTMAL